MGAHDTTQEFDAFFRRHFPAVARSSALVVRDHAAGEELAQEAFTRLLVRWHKMESDDHARNFVFKVALNLSRTYLRKHGRVSVGEVPERAGSAWETGVEDRLVLDDALAGLSARQRSVVVLIDYAGYDSESAGRLLGLRASTVRVHLMRARQALAAALEPEAGS